MSSILVGFSPVSDAYGDASVVGVSAVVSAVVSATVVDSAVVSAVVSEDA